MLCSKSLPSLMSIFVYIEQIIKPWSYVLLKVLTHKKIGNRKIRNKGIVSTFTFSSLPLICLWTKWSLPMPLYSNVACSIIKMILLSQLIEALQYIIVMKWDTCSMRIHFDLNVVYKGRWPVGPRVHLMPAKQTKDVSLLTFELCDLHPYTFCFLHTTLTSKKRLNNSGM